MANEITVTTGVRLTNGLLIVPNTVKATQFNQTTARGGGPGVVDVGTSEETIGFGDCVPGFVELVNLDPTNYVQVGFSTGVYGIRLRPSGGCCVFELEPSGTVYVKANTDACKVKATALNI